jgi:RHS repeat-associated protein
LIYRYDAAGNRVFKQYIRGTRIEKTWYVRDAQGNTLAVYGNKDGGAPIYWKEQHLYGSSRLGIWNADMELSGGNSSTKWQELGNKSYELSNHLGNVLVTISDKPVDVVSGGVIDHYDAEVLSAQDYYPFGMLQPDRKWSLGSYRYGFNGKENDNEVKGEGNQQDYGMRVYDPRLGKFLSVDPLTPKYPELTPYQFSGNTPIQATDLDGAETFIQRQGNATRQYAEMKIAKEEQVRIQSEKNRYPELHILLADIYGNGHMGPESIVRQNVAAIKNEHDASVADAIRGGPLGAAGYMIGGDESALKWSAAEGVMMSFVGIPAKGSSVFPRAVDVGASRFVPNTQGGATNINLKRGSQTLSKAAAGIPPGFDYMADSKVWRITPKNLAESALMNAAQSGFGDPIMGAGTNKTLGDPRLKDYNITKYSISVEYNTPLGTSTNAVIHYLKNNETGALFDFKFDDRSTRKPVMTPESSASFYSTKKK